MDEKTKELVEAAERHAELPDNYDVAEHARDDVPELCTIIREQAAQLEQLKQALPTVYVGGDRLKATSLRISAARNKVKSNEGAGHGRLAEGGNMPKEIHPLTPEMLWAFRRAVLGGRSAVPPHAELPKTLSDCNPGVQADHYAQACYVHASVVLVHEHGAVTVERLGVIEVPPLVTEERAAELRALAVRQVLADHGQF